MWIFVLQHFNLMMPLILSKHFPVWVALQMSVGEPHGLGLAKHVWLSCRMSVSVSIHETVF